ncbi:MAG: hypothetical protein R2769_00290 [Saprospiraceae bacterium]
MTAQKGLAVKYYAFWNQNYSTCSPGFFTRSTVNSGDTYEECTVLPEELRWGTLHVGPQGELYAAGMVRNSEDGKMYVAKSINASNPNQPVSWDFVTEVNLDGRLGGIKGQGGTLQSGRITWTGLGSHR